MRDHCKPNLHPLLVDNLHRQKKLFHYATTVYHKAAYKLSNFAKQKRTETKKGKAKFIKTFAFTLS